jgi:hypothetical protein
MPLQRPNQGFCCARMYGWEIRDRAGRLSGGHRCRNQVHYLSGMRSYCDTSQKASSFSVDQAFDCHLFALDGGKIVIGKNRTTPGKCFDWQSRSFCLFLVPANTCDGRLGMEKLWVPPFVESNRSSENTQASFRCLIRE